MTTKPRVRKYRGRRFYDPEPQYHAPVNPDDMFSRSWVVYRQRPLQHSYGLRFNGGDIGYLLRFTDGWRWQTTWSPGDRHPKGRLSSATYKTWQAAASRLIRTDVGRTVCRGQKPPDATAWRPFSGVTPWEPKPAEPEQTTEET